MIVKSRGQNSSISKILSAQDLIRLYERHEVVHKSKLLARELWKRLVKNVGERQAKMTMLEIMGDKQSGPRNEFLINFIRDFIRYCGPDQSDEKIAKHILKSKPEIDVDVFIASKEKVVEIQTKKMRIDKGLAALKKQVGRIRREMIEEGSLPKDYAPRPYCRD
jgi:hypothetical protein